MPRRFNSTDSHFADLGHRGDVGIFGHVSHDLLSVSPEAGLKSVGRLTVQAGQAATASRERDRLRTGRAAPPSTARVDDGAEASSVANGAAAIRSARNENALHPHPDARGLGANSIRPSSNGLSDEAQRRRDEPPQS
jgi:hypothetical protein